MNSPVSCRVFLYLFIITVCLNPFNFGNECAGQSQILRICTYNVLDGPVSASDDQDFRVVIEAIGNQTVLGNTQAIDILAFQEGPSDAAQYNDIEANFEAVFGGSFSSTITTPDFAGCRTGFIYNTQRVQLVAATTLGVGLTHNSRRALFRPVGGTSADDFFIYSIHLKAGTISQEDADTRQEEAVLIRNNAATLSSNAQIIYCGDFNIAGSDETAYQEFFSGSETSTARETLNAPFGFRDNTNWQENIAFLPFHTQNPVNNMDDRFDMFFINDNLQDGQNTEYIPGSCTVLGNNGTHSHNQSINTGTGTAGFGTELVFTSDHLPVFCDLRWGQTPPELNESISLDAISTNFVRQAGPVTGAIGDSDMEVEGSSNGNFASFGIVDFSLKGQLSGGKVADVDNIALTLVQDNEFFTDSGPYSVFVASEEAAKVTIDSSIQYQAGQNSIACVPAVLSNGAEKIATYAGVHDSSGSLLPDGTIDQIALYGSPIEDAIAAALQSNGRLRLLIVPDIPATAVTFTGFTSGLGIPSLDADFLADDGFVDVSPLSIGIANGTQGGGFVGGVEASDDERIEYFAAPQPDADTPPILISFSGVLPTETPQEVVVTVEANVNSPNLELVVEQFNFTTGLWDVLDMTNSEMTDTTFSVPLPTASLSDYVSAGGFLISRAGWRQTGAVLQFPWKTNIDLLQWSVLE